MKKSLLVLAKVLFVMSGSVQGEDLISHASSCDVFQQEYYVQEALKREGRTCSDEEVHEWVAALSEFELGRYLLQNKGLNGYWISRIIQSKPEGKYSDLERWFLFRAPTTIATRERWSIFCKHLQDELRDGVVIGSVPCGVMDDVLSLDFSQVSEVKILGVDLDAQSIDYARKGAQDIGIDNVEFKQVDAWDMDIHEQLDVLRSNGLNIYVHDDERVVELYKSFCKALKPGGRLIASFITPPPIVDSQSPWRNIDQADLKKQKVLFSEIIGVGWQAFRSEEKTRKQLEEAGFEEIKFEYDSQAVFPTVTARKRG